MNNSTFTTGQVAAILNVAARTVSNWVDSGQLEGRRIPESKRRQIPRESLIRFMKKHGVPLSALGGGSPIILLVGANETTIEAEDFQVEVAGSCFEAGKKVGLYHPVCVVIDFSIGHQEALAIANGVRNESRSTVLIGLTNNNDVDTTTFTETFRKPVDPVLLVERIRMLVQRTNSKQ